MRVSTTTTPTTAPVLVDVTTVVEALTTVEAVAVAVAVAVAARTAEEMNVSREAKGLAILLLTRAPRCGESDHAGGLRGVSTSLVGAVADSVTKVCIFAVAVVVARGATELGDGQCFHVTDTCGLEERGRFAKSVNCDKMDHSSGKTHTTGGQVGGVLGEDGARSESEVSESKLHSD